MNQQTHVRPSKRQVLWGGGIVVVSFLAISILGGYIWEWSYTGIVKGNDFPKRTLWDWLKLLIVPAALAIGVYWLNQLQTERERNAQAAQRARELEIESARAKDEALQAYLGHMSQLPLELRSLEGASQNAQELLMQVARARTLTVLQRLDGRRKRSVLQFLTEGGLIDRGNPSIGLRGADLSDADLNEARLNETDLRGANLRGADLRGADLRGADLQGADLPEAILCGLREAGLREFGLTNTQIKALIQGIAKLRDANLREAVLTDATVTQTQLILCDSLQSATMPNGQGYAGWLKSPEGQWFYRALLEKQGAEDGTNGGP